MQQKAQKTSPKTEAKKAHRPKDLSSHIPPIIKRGSLIKLCVFLLLLASGLALLFFNSEDTWSHFNRQGLSAFQKKDTALAEKNFRQALGKKPFDPWSYMNLALALSATGKAQEALRLYDIVASHLKDRTQRMLFFSFFNQAELYGRLGQRDLALRNYQKALEISKYLQRFLPHEFKQREKDVKINIELLMKEQQQKKQKKTKPQKQEKNKTSQEEEQKQRSSSQEEESQEKESKSSSEEEQTGKKPSSEESQQNKDSNKEKATSPQQDPKNQDEGQEPSLGSKKSGEKEQSRPPSENLSLEAQEAILKEAEKQENSARKRFYRPKTGLGNTSDKDW